MEQKDCMEGILGNPAYAMEVRGFANATAAEHLIYSVEALIRELRQCFPSRERVDRLTVTVEESCRMFRESVLGPPTPKSMPNDFARIVQDAIESLQVQRPVQPFEPEVGTPVPSDPQEPSK